MLQNEIRITKYIVFSAILLGIALLVIKLNQPQNKFLSPISLKKSIFSFFSETKPTKTIYGFLPYWSLDKEKYFDYNILTDIAFFGLDIDEKGNFIRTTDEGFEYPGYSLWQQSEILDKILKEAKEHNVSVALTIISHNNEISDKFLDCISCWDNLAQNTIKQLKHRDIKDAHINFEYSDETPKETAMKYSKFVEFLNLKLDAEFGDSKVIVSSFADSLVKRRVTDIETLGKIADGIFIMGYDFHRPDSDFAGPIAPIYGKGVYAEYDIDTMLKDYLSVAPPSKIILGVPYYGYNWVVESEDKYAKRIPGDDNLGYSQSQTYESVMQTISEVNPKVLWDDLARAPYFSYTSPDTGAKREVYYENKDSLREKYKLAKNLNLKGVGIWALGYDGSYKDLWELLKEEFAE